MESEVYLGMKFFKIIVKDSRYPIVLAVLKGTNADAAIRRFRAISGDKTPVVALEKQP